MVRITNEILRQQRSSLDITFESNLLRQTLYRSLRRNISNDYGLTREQTRALGIESSTSPPTGSVPPLTKTSLPHQIEPLETPNSSGSATTIIDNGSEFTVEYGVIKQNKVHTVGRQTMRLNPPIYDDPDIG